MDERILKILKAVAIEKTYGDDISTYCIFCNGDRDYNNQGDDIVHESTCETIEARAILKEQGTPLYEYLVTFEAPISHDSRFGQRYTHYQQGFSEQEVRALYPENADNKNAYPKRRNIQIEQVRER